MASDHKMIFAVCPVCKASNGVSSAFIGKKVICQNCEEIFICHDPKIIEEKEIAEKQKTEKAVPSKNASRSSPPQTDSKKFPVVLRLALTYNFLSREKCYEIFSIYEKKKSMGENVSIEALLKAQQFLLPEQLLKIQNAIKYLEIKQKDKDFCAHAVEMGFVLSSEALAAIEQQVKEFRDKNLVRRVGEILLEMEAITEIEYSLILKRLETEKPKENITFRPEVTVNCRADKEKQQDIFNGETFKITVSEDGLKAYLLVNGNAGVIKLDDLKEKIAEIGIVYGIVDEKHIMEFLEKWACSNRKFKIAEGAYPVPGRHARIIYYFDKDHLKAGTINDSGVIDYKNRGEIPFVKKGELLAEKFPLKPSTAGIDVYGNTVPIEEPMDVDFYCGVGTAFSDDRQMIFADTDGYPSSDIKNVISVMQGIHIEGDVGYETGHVEFDGHIHVEGMVKEGFCVKGVSLSAREIVGAEIDVTGDISVKDGIINSKIRTQGNIEATYLRNSDVFAFGNMFIDKQIIESRVVLSGVCDISRGVIVSSDISARQGIKVYEIGTDISSPNKIRVGTDQHANLVINRIQGELDKKEKNKKALNGEMLKIKDGLENIFNLIAEMAHVQDRAMKQHASILETMEKFTKKKKPRRLGPAEISLKECEDQVKQADITINRLFATQNSYKDKIERIRDKVRKENETIIDLNSKKNVIFQFLKREKANPTIVAFGSVHAKTMVFGRHATRVLEETFRNVRIKEVQVTIAGLKATHEIRVYNKTY